MSKPNPKATAPALETEPVAAEQPTPRAERESGKTRPGQSLLERNAARNKRP